MDENIYSLYCFALGFVLDIVVMECDPSGHKKVQLLQM